MKNLWTFLYIIRCDFSPDNVSQKFYDTVILEEFHWHTMPFTEESNSFSSWIRADFLRWSAVASYQVFFHQKSLTYCLYAEILKKGKYCKAAENEQRGRIVFFRCRFWIYFPLRAQSPISGIKFLQRNWHYHWQQSQRGIFLDTEYPEKSYLRGLYNGRIIIPVQKYDQGGF